MLSELIGRGYLAQYNIIEAMAEVIKIERWYW
jgi:hypothetical protein